MKQNKQHGLKSTNYNLQRWPFEPPEESLCFLRGLLEWMTEATKINGSYIFILKSHVIAKHGNCSKEIAGRWKNNSLGVVCELSNRKTLSGETLCFLEKHFANNI